MDYNDFDVREAMSQTADVEELALIFTNERRNIVIEVLEDVEESSISSMADLVAERQYSGEYDSNQRKSVYASLKQSHLPQLDDVDVIDYDSQRGCIKVGDSHRVYLHTLQLLNEIVV